MKGIEARSASAQLLCCFALWISFTTW